METQQGFQLQPSNQVGFNFTQAMWELCDQIVCHTPELSHVRMSQVAVSFAQARSKVLHGMQAKLTPMRFEDGSLVLKDRGREWTVQRLYDESGVEKLYILTFYLPRYLQHSFEEKLQTVFHELWHIHPDFNGDLRRFSGRCYMHSSSQSNYDAFADGLAKKWLSTQLDESAYHFLKLTFNQLYQQYGAVYGVKVQTPKLLPNTKL